MLNYYKYLPIGVEDEKWGLSILNAGCTQIGAHEQYPYNYHPQHHYFNWDSGRILNEYQAIYIIKGKGFFESSSMECTKVEEGSLIILFPGEWHRFKPDENVGWDEYWVGFQGEIADNLIKNKFFNSKEALINIGIKEEVVSLITEIIEHTKEEKSGYQPLVSGALLHLLGYVHRTLRQQQFKEENHVEIIINKARILLRQKIDAEVSMEDIAKELNVSYSWLRKMFKTYTGIALGQYLIQLKIERAKTLLSNPSKTIKEIAYDLHFESCFYFSKLFKEKTGLSPDVFRNKMNSNFSHQHKEN
jgi:AraC-like DNA-binding protein